MTLDQSSFEERYLSALNPQQREAVLTTDGPVLLLATPGSGKTTVLVTRLGYMILCLGIDPSSILTMTYTRAAAMDMKKRYEKLFGTESAVLPAFRTINGVSYRIIQHYGKTLGSEPFRLEESEGKLNSLLRDIVRTVTEEFPEDSVIKDLRTQIAYIKNMMLTEEQIQALSSDTEQLPEIYKRYQSELRKRRIMDYDDQMVYAYQILRQYPEVLSYIRNKFRYLCVDEAQDTSKIQHEIIKLLAAGNENLFMVGDEDQSIYGFRAAYPEALLSFQQDHPGARVLLAEQNYRSTKEIISVANAFVARNLFRHEKKMVSTRPSGSPVRLIQCDNRRLQYSYLAEAMKTCDRETGILFRNNESALPLIDSFEKNGIPYNCRNVEDIFFSHRVVADILDILRFSFSPSDAEIFMRIYYKFGAKISRKSAQYAVQRSAQTGKPIFTELIHAPDIRGPVQDTVIDLAETLPKLPSCSAEMALFRVWETMRYGKYVEQRGLDVGKYFILKLLAEGVLDVSAFFAKLGKLRETITQHVNRPENLVTLSTIHSSKGLEYDRVFLLDIIDGILPTKTEYDVKDDAEIKLYQEERRLYYVGMTRAKDELYLFSCGESSSFTAEAAGHLPRSKVDDGDVFAALSQSLMGKSYTDAEHGVGEIVAQSGDECLIRFSDRQLRLMRLPEMLSRRAQTLVYPKEKRSSKQKQSANSPSGSSQRRQRLIRGDTVRHKTFGTGVVAKVEKDSVTVDFRSKGRKKFTLEAVNKGLLWRT